MEASRLDVCFEAHERFMRETDFTEGETEPRVLVYNITKCPELKNPLNPYEGTTGYTKGEAVPINDQAAVMFFKGLIHYLFQFYGDAGNRTDPTTVDELRGLEPLKASGEVSLWNRSLLSQLGSLALLNHHRSAQDQRLTD